MRKIVKEDIDKMSKKERKIIKSNVKLEEKIGSEGLRKRIRKNEERRIKKLIKRKGWKRKLEKKEKNLEKKKLMD